MSVASGLRDLARIVPGVAGYQDRERARDTDHAVRMRLAAALERAGQDVETAKRALVEARSLEGLLALDRVTGRLEGLAATVRYAGRGYRGLFHTPTVDAAALETVYVFDLRMLAEADSITATAGRLASCEPAQMIAMARALDTALTGLARAYAERDTLLDGGGTP